MVKKYYIFAFLTCLFVFSLSAQNDLDTSIDLIEKYSDTVGRVKEEKKQILPIALPITEPAVGYGLMAGALYFIPKEDNKQQADMIAAAGGLTSNGTWIAGVGYLGYWKNDRLRYTGFAGYGHISWDYYGFGDEPIAFEQDASMFMQQLKFRIRDSKFYLGGKLQISKMTIPVEFANIDPEDFEVWNNGLGIIAEYDHLDNSLSPGKGLKVHAGYDQILEVFGSKRDWGRFTFYSHWYLKANRLWSPAFRFEFLTAAGDPPFYAYPYVRLRGIPALRYQAKSTILIETEQLFNISPRWGIVGFTGIGSTLSSVNPEINNEVVWNAGGGVRFLALKKVGVKVGLDLARGPEESAFYVSVGSAW